MRWDLSKEQGQEFYLRVAGVQAGGKEVEGHPVEGPRWGGKEGL